MHQVLFLHTIIQEKIERKKKKYWSIEKKKFFFLLLLLLLLFVRIIKMTSVFTETFQ